MKKIANILLATLIGVSVTLPAAGCKDKDGCEHNVGTWVAVTPATCTNTGVEEGVCGECLKTQTREIPVDPDAHAYGDWTVQQPTDTAVGTASRICTEDETHTVSTELPVLSSSLYLTEIVERPTPAKEGSRSYTIKHDTGKITFYCPIPNTGIQSVLDAVGLGSGEESRALVRKADGKVGLNFIRPWAQQPMKGAGEDRTDKYITRTSVAGKIEDDATVSYSAGGYSTKLTVYAGAAKGGFRLNGSALNKSFTSSTGTAEISAVTFMVYNADGVDHTYELYHRMTGERSVSGYTGVLKATAWTEVKITKEMWLEAAADPSRMYSKTGDGEMVVTNGARGSAGEQNHFLYVDCFNDVYLSQTPESHGYQFGENYTYIIDGVKNPETGVITGGADNCERWYFTDAEGELYGLTNHLDGKTQSKKIKDDLAGSGQEDYVNGSRLYLQYANGLGTYFGVESLLEGLYRYARTNVNGDFVQEAKAVGDKTEYSFSFGFVENSGKDSGYFSKITVTFTLTANYVIESLNVGATIYVNNFGQVDENQNPLPDVHTWSVDDKGYAYVLNGQENGERYISTISFAQTEKAAGDEVPVNPHSLDKVYVQDFKIFYKGIEVPSGQEVALAVTDDDAIIRKEFSISGIQPEGLFEKYDFDKFSFYLRTEQNGSVVDTPLRYDTDDTITVQEEGGKFGLNSKLSGLQKVVVKTKYVEKVILCRFSSTPPSYLIAKGYLYDRTAKEYSPWASVGRVNGHYVGQPFYFTAEVPEDEKTFAAGNYSYTVTKNGAAVAESCLGNAVRGGKNAEVFTPNEAGRYTIEMVADLAEADKAPAKCTITLNVVAAPTFESLTSAEKTYEGDLVLFETEHVEVTFTNYAVNGVEYTATATVTKYVGEQVEATETLSCSYKVGEISGTWELSSTHAGGATLGYVLSLNEAYDFVVSQRISWDGFTEEVECVLTQKASA